MDIDKLTIGEARELAQLFGAKASKPCPFKVGEQVFIRTVTHYLTGRIIDITGDFLTLEDAAWIADTGRFADALIKAEFSEVEPIKGLDRVNMGSFVDVIEWPYPLPQVQK